MNYIRPCRPDDFDAILAIINAGAEAYRGVIPEDRWHDPYMSANHLEREMAAGVTFSGYEADGKLIGVMGIQRVLDADIIRHAYVRPEHQGRGVGGRLLGHLRNTTNRKILIGTWADASWAIDFYKGQGFELVAQDHAIELLKTYWDIPARQALTSVVLAMPDLEMAGT